MADPVDRLMAHLPAGWRVAIVPAAQIPTWYAACYYPGTTIVLALRDECSMTRSLCHEVAHALCPPGEGHGVAWLRTCRQLWAEAGLGTQGFDWMVEAHLGRDTP
jgi:hypothetical protein